MEGLIFSNGIKHRSFPLGEGEGACLPGKGRDGASLLFINEHQVSDIGHLSFYSHPNGFKNNGLSVGIAVVKLIRYSLYTII